jgi:hypothetical protein
MPLARVPDNSSTPSMIFRTKRGRFAFPWNLGHMPVLLEEANPSAAEIALEMTAQCFSEALGLGRSERGP